jgi:hypothetical protein
MSNLINDWLEAQRINGGPHGFECIGIARMQQVWDAAQEDLIKQLASQEIVKQGAIDMLNSMNDDLRQQLASFKVITKCMGDHGQQRKKENDQLRQQVTLLRNAIEYILEYWNGDNNETAMHDALNRIDEVSREALAATEADLAGLLLCEKKPVATMEAALDAFVDGISLYRAKEQWK